MIQSYVASREGYTSSKSCNEAIESMWLSFMRYIAVNIHVQILSEKLKSRFGDEVRIGRFSEEAEQKISLKHTPTESRRHAQRPAMRV